MDGATTEGVARVNTLERLKGPIPGPCELVSLEFNKLGNLMYCIEFPGVTTGSVPEARRLEAGINALPDLLAVVEAAQAVLSGEQDDVAALMSALAKLTEEV